ncbi:Translin-1 [Malassezia sp. CBS 17886]|nr:Translin-1 [Malassezia sp. CBS 17886]
MLDMSALDRVIADVEAERATGDLLRERVKHVDRAQRIIAMRLSQAQAIPAAGLPAHLTDVSAHFGDLRSAIADVTAAVPDGQYYKWNDLWTWAVRQAVFSTCLVYFLGGGDLLPKEDVGEVLGMNMLASDRMMLSTDEYLHGVISMVNELPRHAVNAVTAGDFAAPVRIAAFVKQVHGAFQVLNLKNDLLRKRFDGLKVRTMAAPSLTAV